MMEHKDKKIYAIPCVAVHDLCAGPLLTVSADTDGYDEKDGRDDVIYEQRRGGWSCDNWIEDEE